MPRTPKTLRVQTSAFWFLRDCEWLDLQSGPASSLHARGPLTLLALLWECWPCGGNRMKQGHPGTVQSYLNQHSGHSLQHLHLLQPRGCLEQIWGRGCRGELAGYSVYQTAERRVHDEQPKASAPRSNNGQRCLEVLGRKSTWSESHAVMRAVEKLRGWWQWCCFCPSQCQKGCFVRGGSRAPCTALAPSDVYTKHKAMQSVCSHKVCCHQHMTCLSKKNASER